MKGGYNMKNIENLREKYREKYKIYCLLNNLVENEKGFRCYLSDQKMLERGREARRKREREQIKLK